MSLLRVIVAAILALVVTLSLLTLMHYLIVNNFVEPKDGTEFKMPNIIMPAKKVENRTDDVDPDKPEKPDEPPPDLPEQNLATPEAGAVSVGKSSLVQEELNIDVGLSGGGGLLLLVQPPPKYPSRAAQNGWEGNCIVKFDVNEAGETENIKASVCSKDVFKRDSEKAVKKYKYRAPVEDGKPVRSNGLSIKIVFEMAQ